MKFFALLAALGLVASTAGELSTYLGFDPPHSLWFLHLGIFVVMIPAVMVQRSQGQAFTWREAMGGAPAWIRWLTVLMVAHAFFNMAAFTMVCGGGGPAHQPDGTYSLSSHGRIIRLITAAEYWRDRGYEFRSFSGWWMLFYSFALTLLVSQINRRKQAGQAVSGQAAPDTLSPTRAGIVPVWLHKTMLLLCLMFGWVGGPLLTAVYILPALGNSFWIWNGLLLLGAWVIWVTVPVTLLRRLVPARCEKCGGRMYCLSVLRMAYHCDHCRHVESGN